MSKALPALRGQARGRRAIRRHDSGSASPFPSAWVNDGLAEFGERDLLVNNFRRFRTLHRAYVWPASVLSPLKLAPRVPPHRSTRLWTCGCSTNMVEQRDRGSRSFLTTTAEQWPAMRSASTRPRAFRRRWLCGKRSGAKATHTWSVCGIPETYYTDHGSDFTSQHLEQVAADLHMALVFSITGKPRGGARSNASFCR